MTVESVLRYHAQLYPAMCPSDAVKLLYQNEFGGGHLIENSAKSLAWIEKEYAQIPHDKSLPQTVPIGNGIVRYNLKAIDVAAMPLSRLNDIFVESSRLVTGSTESFCEKLRLLSILVEEELFSFSSEQLAVYLNEYKQQVYPPISHSPQFREAYAPAYRVILEKLL